MGSEMCIRDRLLVVLGDVVVLVVDVGDRLGRAGVAPDETEV